MTTFKDFINKFRHFFRFSKEEIEACTISVLVIAFIVSFDEWGYGTNFDLNIGLINFLRAIVIVGLIIGMQILVIKTQAIQWGYRAEFKLWWYGIFIGLGLCFLTGSFTNDLGKAAIIWFLAPGGVFFHHLATHRLGWFRYGVNLMETGLCALLGSLSTIILAILFKFMLYFLPGNPFLEKAVIVSLWYAFFSLLPIPPLNGSRIFFWSRLSYVFLCVTFLAGTLLIRLNINLLITIIISFIIGFAVWFIYYIKVEK